ncbi:MAG TPA: type VI secretion system tip protein TssI/VgrG, partial [Pyrinomonadaceae bacterium]|nr:type VI secretion system tip protein TssI/VgrG [Pyrinomonadaceae bacterium]
PHVWILTQNVQSRIFQHQTVPDILRKVFADFEVSYEIQGDFKPRNFCVQYRESDFDFASRLMEEEGIYYYFEHDGNMDKLVIGNTPQSHRDCPNKSQLPYVVESGSEEIWASAIRSWKTEYTLQSGKVTNWDYNFQLPTNKLDGEQPSQFSHGDNQKMEIYDFPGGYARKYDGIDKSGGEQAASLNSVYQDKQNTVKIQMQALDAQVKVSKGYSDCCTLTAGYRFKLNNHPSKALNTQYVITTVQHQAEQTPDYSSGDESAIPYESTFNCIPHGAGVPVFRPLMKTPKPIVNGTQTAVVVGPAGEEIFTDKYGRVKVNFHWDRELKFDPDSSCWVRVAREIAGKKWGSMHIPRIGQEVIVDFEEGDPDKPIIVGAVYNPETMPHYELPKFKTLTYFKTRTSPDDGKGFNELRFEDKGGKEQVFIRSQKRMDVRVLQSLYETCGGNRQEVIGMRQDNKPGGNLAISVGGNYDLHVKGDWYIGIDGKLNEGVKGDVVEGYDSNQSTVVKSKVEINAQNITLEGSQSVNLKVGSSCIIVDMMGITIQGPMVKINSGGSASPTSPATLDSPLDAETADTGEPGYLDRPRKGGGGGRKSRTLNGQHAPSVTYNPSDKTYSVGGDKLKVKGTDDFVGKTMKDLSTLYNTPTGKKVIDNINAGKHTTTIETLDEATAKKNGGLATPSNGADSKTPGKGSDTKVQYNPDVPDGGYTDENGKPVVLPNAAMLGHELIHAMHNDKGQNKIDNPEPTEPDSNEEESQTIGIHGHKDDELTHNNLLKDLGDPHRRTDHDTTVVTAPK